MQELWSVFTSHVDLYTSLSVPLESTLIHWHRKASGINQIVWPVPAINLGIREKRCQCSVPTPENLGYVV